MNKKGKGKWKIEGTDEKPIKIKWTKLDNMDKLGQYARNVLRKRAKVEKIENLIILKA